MEGNNNNNNNNNKTNHLNNKLIPCDVKNFSFWKKKVVALLDMNGMLEVVENKLEDAEQRYWQTKLAEEENNYIKKNNCHIINKLKKIHVIFIIYILQ